MTNVCCPVCESGDLVAGVYEGEVEHKGQICKVPELEYSTCSSCGADPVLSDQARRNQVRYADAKRTLDGFLTSTEIRRARAQLGITQHQASFVFGGGLNAFSKYERGEVLQSEAMDKLIRVACLFEEVSNYLTTGKSSSEARIRVDSIVLDRQESIPIECMRLEESREALFGKVFISFSEHGWTSQEEFSSANEIMAA